MQDTNTEVQIGFTNTQIHVYINVIQLSSSEAVPLNNSTVGVLLILSTSEELLGQYSSITQVLPTTSGVTDCEQFWSISGVLLMWHFSCKYSCISPVLLRYFFSINDQVRITPRVTDREQRWLEASTHSRVTLSQEWELPSVKAPTQTYRFDFGSLQCGVNTLQFTHVSI